MANSPYGPQTGGAPSPGPYGDQRKGSKAVGPYHNVEGRPERMRATLRKNGYDVDARGPITQRMLKAWHAYRTGIHPDKWNKVNARPGVGRPQPNLLDRVASTSAKAAKAVVHKDLIKEAAKPNKVKLKAAVHGAALAGGKGPKNPQVGGSDIPGVKIGNPNVNKVIPAATADKIAGLTFDPQIREALVQQQQGKRDTAQAQADLSNWYGQVEGSQATATQRDTAAAGSARSAVSNELQGILQSLGGSRGAGVVGAQGLADLTALAAQGQSQDQYNADLAPILKGEEAGQHSRQQALASQTAAALGNKLIDLRGQRGQAQAQALMQILQANNQARQGNFGNRLAVQSTNAASALAGLKQADIVSQITSRDKRAKAYVNSVKSKLTSKGTPAWGQLSAGDKLTAVQKALGPYLDPTSGALLPGANPNDVLNKARQTLRGLGFSSARRAGYKGRGVNPRAQADILSLLHSQLSGAMSPQRQALPQTTQ